MLHLPEVGLVPGEEGTGMKKVHIAALDLAEMAN